jgi:hypothetical protein
VAPTLRDLRLLGSGPSWNPKPFSSCQTTHGGAFFCDTLHFICNVNTFLYFLCFMKGQAT